jgi:hypothetical protein
MMEEIKFDLGKNIEDTAKASGVPQFQTRDVNGYVSYDVKNIPTQIAAHYSHPGHEIVWQPVFSLTLYSDRKRSSDLSVETAAISLNSSIESHEAAQTFVEQTIAQFQKGKWQRYYDPIWDTLLTGRSSLLDESGRFDRPLRTIDPTYKVPTSEWPKLMENTPVWRWVGDGVLASLSGSFDNGDGRKLSYGFDLEFELLNVALERDAQNLAQRLKEGDAKGWNSTAKHEAEMKARAEQLKRLEANAIKRGDSVVTPH